MRVTVLWEESLLDAALKAMQKPLLQSKPTPNERDSILNAARWSTPEVRRAIGQRCPSFQRIVDKTAAHLRRH